MKKNEQELFNQKYLSTLQLKMKLADTTFMWGVFGRGSGKTTEMLAARIDRVQNAMPGALLVLGASTYISIFENILPGIMQFFDAYYTRGIYFEIGKKPPRHFAKCSTSIEVWKHTISFCNGCVIQFVSCDRPESMLGKSAAHLFVDEMIKIPEEKFVERIMPALRSDRSKFGHSEYFMGVTGFSSAPNCDTDEDWFMKYEQNMNKQLLECIQEIAYEIDLRRFELEIAKQTLDYEKIKKLEIFIQRWSKRLTEYRRGQTMFIRASSFSNLKILGIDYIQNQIKSIKDENKLYTSIFSIKKDKVKEMFFGKFGKKHIFSDSYNYDLIDSATAGSELDKSSKHLKHCDRRSPLFAGFDPGPFMSIVFGQKKLSSQVRELRIIKNFFVIHPDQHAELAREISEFFKFHQNKTIYLHYDRAANQENPRYRTFYTSDVGVTSETDARLFQAEMKKHGWNVILQSLGQSTILYSTHYALLNILFSKNDGRRDDILLCQNECEELISSINKSPLKRHEGRIILDKSSERLPYEDQAFNSTQIATAFLYLLYGEYKRLLPRDY